MRFNPAKARPSQLAVILTVATLLAAGLLESRSVARQIISVRAAGFQIGSASAVTDATNQYILVLSTNPVSKPLNQSAVKQDPSPALLGPDAHRPYFKVRFALPIPPENDTNLTGTVAGLDANVLAHNHSPGFEILPNGDALAVYFTAATSRGASESASTNCFVQARLRCGAEQWDLPELFFDFEGFNEQSGLLWNDAGTIRFFGGGRGASAMMPFKQSRSTDNGATWTTTLPQLDKPATDCTPQPINSGFRGSDGAMYFAMDAEENESFLWRSADGVHWSDVGGRTGARHSTIVPLNDHGWLLSLGGKNNSVNGWTPQNISTNNGVTWSSNAASVFPALGGNQRPSLIRLANGHLFYASDSYIRKSGKSPEGWVLGQGAFVAISTNNGANWQFKNLPVTLPHHEDRHFGTLGYVTARQAPNGVIHILATMTQPCLHYELNEAWVFSDVSEAIAETAGGTVKKFSEKYSNGQTRSKWSARIYASGRYVLDGKETDYYESGQRQREVTYANGFKTGRERFWAADGRLLWEWKYDPANQRAVWTQFWPNGKKKLLSTWNTSPEARDAKRHFTGFVADGPVKHWREDGSLEFEGSFVNGQFGGKALL